MSRNHQNNHKEGNIPCVLYCEECGEKVNQGIDGGIMTIPIVITNKPQKQMILHNRCVKSYITRAEKNRVYIAWK